MCDHNDFNDVQGEINEERIEEKKDEERESEQ